MTESNIPMPSLPLHAVADREIHERAVEVVYTLVGLSISQAEAVIEVARTLIRATHYVAIDTPDFIAAEGSAHGFSSGE